MALATLILLQVSLGLASWVVKYGFPAWFEKYVWTLPYTVVAKGWIQALTVTAHVGVGSLCGAAAVSLTLGSNWKSNARADTTQARSEYERPTPARSAVAARI